MRYRIEGMYKGEKVSCYVLAIDEGGAREHCLIHYPGASVFTVEPDPVLDAAAPAQPVDYSHVPAPEVQTDPRKLGTMLAALRYWQSHGAPDATRQYGSISLLDVATDDGAHDALSAAEIDALCEELNTDTAAVPALAESAPLILTAPGQSVVTATAAVDALAMFVRAVDSWQDDDEPMDASDFIALIETTAENARNVLAGQS